MSRYLDRIAGRPLTGTTPAPETKPVRVPKRTSKPTPTPKPAPAPVVEVKEESEG